MSGLSIHLTNDSLSLADLDVTEWVNLGDLMLSQTRDGSWELRLTLTVFPDVRLGAARQLLADSTQGQGLSS